MSATFVPRECPYVGLEPFQPAYAAYFFGRRFDSRVLADHVRSRRTTVLFGASGVGKSSVINVGLPAALAAGVPWTVVCLRNWQNLEDLEQAAVDAVIAALAPEERPRTSRTHKLRFAPLITWAIRATKRPLLLILDQFEEYFLYRDRDRMRETEALLGTLSEKRNLPLHLLFALRDDGLYRLDELRAFVPSILSTMMELGHLDDDGIKDAIEGPINRYNKEYRSDSTPIVVDPGLAPSLIRQLKESDASMGLRRAGMQQRDFIELPYLQLALTKLWNAEGGAEATAIRESTLDRLGGVGRIIRDHVDTMMGKLAAREQALCAKMFDRLVTSIGGKVAYPTKALAAPEVIGENVSEQAVDAILNKLAKEARILKPIVTANGLPGYEIFHDVLGLPVLEWRRNFERKAASARLRRVRALVYVLIAVIVGLVGWFNQKFIKTQWYAFSQVRPYVLTGAAERALKPADSFKECTDCPKLIVVPMGTFSMGSPPDEKGRDPNEGGPPHQVVFARPLAISEFEITFAQWDNCVAYGDCPSSIHPHWTEGLKPVSSWDEIPVINVSWDDVKAYVAWLSKMTGKHYRLLTEAEWEYAARARSTTAYFWGNDIKKDGKPMANCAGCGSIPWEGKRATPVGQFPANDFGMHDMSGNVWEWVEDCYVPNYDQAPADGSARMDGDCNLRVARGGSWGTTPADVRSARRIPLPTSFRLYSVGLRVARTLTP